jgi:WD40 repeat protein/DNA-binding CsgD family transcriptional regulator
MSEISGDFLEVLAKEYGISNSELEVLVHAVGGTSPNLIAKNLGLSPEAVRKRLSEVYKKFQVIGTGPGKQVRLQQLINSYYQDSLQKKHFLEEVSSINLNINEDWGEAPSIPLLSGRGWEIEEIRQWVVEDNCKLVAILGMGGIGKTALSVRCAGEVKADFNYVIWRSLRHAPKIDHLLPTIIRFIADEELTKLPENIDELITLLLHYLRSSRCLLVLDNLETIMESGQRAGSYAVEHKYYGELIRRLGEEPHKSCLLITSREKPKELVPLEGDASAVRSLALTGVGTVAGQEILHDKGLFGKEENWETLIKHYSGNPLALKLVSETIRELFGGDIALFEKEGEIIFGDTRNLLDQHFNRLSSLEREVMYWLAIKRESVSLEDLLENIVRPLTKRELLEAFESLRRRCLIDKQAARFTLQPVVMEYVTERLIDKVCNEIYLGDIEHFINQPLMEANAKEYIRDSQIKLILNPVSQRLLDIFQSPKNVMGKLMEVLNQQRGDKVYPLPGYTAGNTINLLRELEINFNECDFSSLYIWQAYLQSLDLHRVNFKNCHFKNTVFTDNFGGLLSIAFNKSGKLIATGDRNGEVRIWLVENLTLLSSFVGHDSGVRCVSFSPDNQTIASSGEDHLIKLWDINTGDCRQTLKGHRDYVRSVEFSPDGHLLASGSDDKSIKLWDVKTGKCVRKLSSHTNFVRSVVFSQDGLILASCAEDKIIKLWYIPTGDCIKELIDHKDRIYSIALTPDSKIIASGSEDKTVKLWNLETGKCYQTLTGHSQGIWSVAFSPDGKILASGSEDKTVKLWDMGNGKCLKTLQGDDSRVWSVAFTKQPEDGKVLLASGSDDSTLRLWDVVTGQCLKTLQGYASRIWSVKFNPAGNILASASDDSYIRLWNPDTGECYQTLAGHQRGVWCTAFSPNGELLASGSGDRSVKLWDVKTGNRVATFLGHHRGIWSVKFSPDGELLASGSGDRSVKFWNIQTGECVSTFSGHPNYVRAVIFHPDKQRIAIASEKIIQLWNIKTGEYINTLLGHQDFLRGISFSPDGNTLVSCSVDKTIRLWNVQDGKCIRILRGHNHWVWSVIFSPDGKTIASGSLDKTIRIWDVETGKHLQTLKGHHKPVWSVAFHPNGHILASGSHDETIKLWDLNTGKYINTLRIPRPYEDMNITNVTGLTEAQIATLRELGGVVEE